MNSRTPPRASFAVFGYLRRLPGMDQEAVHLALKELVAFVEQRSFALAGVYYERGPGERLATWAMLVLGCHDESVSVVVVPSPAHFHRDALIAAFMRAELAQKIGGTVLYVDDANAAPDLGAGRREQ